MSSNQTKRMWMSSNQTWLVMFPNHLESLTAKPKRLVLKMVLQLVLQVYSVMMMCEVPSVFFKQETAIHPQKDVINEGIAPKVPNENGREKAH